MATDHGAARTGGSGRRATPRDADRGAATSTDRAWVGWLAGLLGVVAFCWCGATGKWTGSAWGLPTSYLVPDHADLFVTLAWHKAAAHGQLIPLLWKQCPELGAPDGANWNDWPMLEEVQIVLFGLLTRAFGLFAGLNLSLLLGHLGAAATLFLVARVTGCSNLWACVGGLAYGLAPYLFAQSPHHITVVYAWHVPLFTLVWRWVATDGPIPRSRFWSAVGIGFITGLQNVYYTNILCQLTLLGAAVHFSRHRSRTGLRTACAVVGAAAVAFALMNLDTWTYGLVHGPNDGALVREYKWLEIYGLKIKDLVIPSVTHRSDAFAAFAKAHWQSAPLQDEYASYQGIVGLACLIWLTGTALDCMIRGREKDVPMEAWQVLWIVLMFTTGGLNAILGAVGVTMFRTGSRFSVVILAITLLWAARRLSMLQAETEAKDGDRATRALWIMTAAVLCGIVLWDQVPRAPTAEQTGLVARQVAADRDFTEAMEATLPPGAMVFQLPVMDFPESPIPGVPPYDHFRPYLHSQRLRFSFGSHKGRARERWQQELQQRLFTGAVPDHQAQRIAFDAGAVRDVIAALRERGFAALYVNRNGFPDGGKGLEKTLRDAGLTLLIESPAGDLVCIPLAAPSPRE